MNSIEVNSSMEKVSYLKDTVHFKKRKFDRMFEIVAKSEQEGFGWIVIDIVSTHDEAIQKIKELRA